MTQGALFGELRSILRRPAAEKGTPCAKTSTWAHPKRWRRRAVAMAACTTPSNAPLPRPTKTKLLLLAPLRLPGGLACGLPKPHPHRHHRGQPPI
jgi:hypothetical protein